MRSDVDVNPAAGRLGVDMYQPEFLNITGEWALYVQIFVKPFNVLLEARST